MQFCVGLEITASLPEVNLDYSSKISCKFFKTVNKFLFLNSSGFQSREYNPQPIKGKDLKQKWDI